MAFVKAKRETRRGERLLKIIAALFIAALAIGLLTDSAQIGQGIRDGILVCGNVLIPSLFPFMVLAGFVSRTDFADILSLPLEPITTKLLKLPAELGAAVLLSLVGGFPVGARMIADMLEAGTLDEKTARRMLAFCVNCGPSFLISAVGTGMLMDKRAGVILLVTQTLATLIIGTCISRNIHVLPKVTKTRIKSTIASSFVASVTGASSSMLIMCAFAMLFSGVLALLRSAGLMEWLAHVLPLNTGVVSAVLSGFFEVTAGCIASAKVGGAVGFGLISACVSFGGLSVLFQVISCFENGFVSLKAFILPRLAHAACAAAMALPLYKIFCGTKTVWIELQPPIMYTDDKTIIISTCLIAMATILILFNGKNTH